MPRVVDEIAQINGWRNNEFIKFKANDARVDESLWCRMCIPMIYAHWEGFVVSALRILIEHLNSLELAPNNVPTKLIVVGLGDSYKTLSGKQSFEQRIQFTEKFKGLFQGSLKFTKNVDTRSNLRATVLKELCRMFSLNFANFKGQTSDIDRLVNIRNSIAHGESPTGPDMHSITKYIDAVNQAMDILLKEIDLFLVNEGYLIKEAA